MSDTDTETPTGFCDYLGERLQISGMLGADCSTELSITITGATAAEMSRRLRQAPRIVEARGRLPLLYRWPRLRAWLRWRP